MLLPPPLPPLVHTMLPASAVLLSSVLSLLSLSLVSISPDGVFVVLPPPNTLSNVDTASALVMPLLPPKLPSG